MTAAIAPRDPMSKYWWVYLVQGIATLILGGFLLYKPGQTLVVMVTFLGIYWLVSGIFSIIGIFVGDRDRHWGWMLASGILGILAGLIVLAQPLVATILVPTVFVLILGVNGIIMGAVGLVHAFKGAGWGPGVWGVISIIFGLILVFNPLIAASVLPWVLGIFGIIGGIALIFMAFRIRSA